MGHSSCRRTLVGGALVAVVDGKRCTGLADASEAGAVRPAKVRCGATCAVRSLHTAQAASVREWRVDNAQNRVAAVGRADVGVIDNGRDAREASPRIACLSAVADRAVVAVVPGEWGHCARRRPITGSGVARVRGAGDGRPNAGSGTADISVGAGVSVVARSAVEGRMQASSTVP